MEKSKIIHYSRSGYNGKYTYTSVCGKEIHTHNDADGVTVKPEEATCSKCLDTTTYKTDIEDFKSTPADIKRRIYIESNILQAPEFRRAQSTVYKFAEEKGLKVVERVFSEVLDMAWHHLDETWQSVKKADEIFATSSLMPLVSNSYMGAPVIFNGMCQRAVSEKVVGKSVIILNALDDIDWYMIDVKLMKKAFKKNDLFMYDAQYKLAKVDTTKIKGK